MEKLLKSLILSGKHLSTLDKVFRQNYPLYRQIAKKLGKSPLYNELRKEIYVGGKKRGKYGYGRQMILGDLLQYILTGRGYYFAVRGPQYREAFIRILMHISNLLILMEDISVDVNLRNKVLDTLKCELGPAFLEDNEQAKAFKSLREFEDKIIPGKGKEYETFFDSILPKRVGGVPELLVYAYLIRKNYGYVIPLLQSQRLLGNQGYITPPDFLLLRSKGETFGLEVGVGKERQIASFSTVTSMPVFTVGIGSPEQPQPYRCGKCQKWIAYCDKVIELCAKNKDKKGEEYIDCTHCSKYPDCPYIIYYGEAYNHSGNVKKLRYHYNCVKNDTLVQERLSKSRKSKLIAPIPWVGGLEHIPQDI